MCFNLEQNFRGARTLRKAPLQADQEHCRESQGQGQQREVLTTVGTAPPHTPWYAGRGPGGRASLSHYCPAEGVRANGLLVQGESWQLHTAYSSATRPEPVTWTPPARPLPTPEMACIKIPSLLAMQIVPGDNEVAREETVLGEIWSTVPSTVAEFLTCHFRKFLSKLPGIIFSRETLTSLSFFSDYVPKGVWLHTHSPLPSLPSLVFSSPFPASFSPLLSLFPPTLCSFLSFFLYSSIFFTWHSSTSSGTKYVRGSYPW